MACKKGDILYLGILAILGLVYTEYVAITQYLNGDIPCRLLIALQFVAALDLHIALKNLHLYFIKHKITLYAGAFNECMQIEQSNDSLVVVWIDTWKIFLVDKSDFRRASDFVKRQNITYEDFVTIAEQLEL